MASCVIEDITEQKGSGQTEKPEPAAAESPSVEDAAAGASFAMSASPSEAAAAPGAAPDTPPMTPPEDCESITPDGGVLKKVLAAGSGEKPSLHARCLGKLPLDQSRARRRVPRPRLLLSRCSVLLVLSHCGAEAAGARGESRVRRLSSSCVGHLLAWLLGWNAGLYAPLQTGMVKPLRASPLVLARHTSPVHYVGYLAASGDVFMDTRSDGNRSEPIILVAGRGGHNDFTGALRGRGRHPNQPSSFRGRGGLPV
jgi:hypothetical protein